MSSTAAPYDIDSDSDLDLPSPFTKQHLKVYDLLNTNQAWDTSCFDQTMLAGRAMYDMAHLIDGLQLGGDFESNASTLYAQTQGPMTDLETHLSYQFANLTTNLALLDSYINDMAHIERLPGFNDLTANGYTVDTSGTGGSYAYMLSSVSPMAMLGPSLSPAFAPETGSGHGGYVSFRPLPHQQMRPALVPVFGLISHYDPSSGKIVYHEDGAPAAASQSSTDSGTPAATGTPIVPASTPVASNAVDPYAFASAGSGNYINVGSTDGASQAGYGGNALAGSAGTSAVPNAGAPDPSINSFGSSGFSSDSSSGSTGGSTSGSSGSTSGGSSGSSGSSGSDGSSGSGSGSSGSSGGACSSVGSGLGSVLGKSSQLMGGLGGIMGQMQGLMGSMMGGGILNAIGQFGNLGNLAKMVPGLSNLSGIQGIVSSIGNMASGNFNVGSLTSGLGQIGGLISSIGQNATTAALGPTLTNMFGGSSNALSNLTQIGNTIQQIGALMPATQAITGPPVLASYSPYAVSNQLSNFATQLSSVPFTAIVAEIQTVVNLIESLMNVDGSSVGSSALQFPTLVQNQISQFGSVQNIVVELQGLANYLSTTGNQANIGDLSSLINQMSAFSSSLTVYIAPNPAITNLQQQIAQLITWITPLHQMSLYLAQVQQTSDSLYNFGGVTGYGNVPNTISQLTGIAQQATNIYNMPGISSLIPSIPNMTSSIGSLTSALNGILPANITQTLGGISGLTTQLGSLANGLGMGNVGQMISGLSSLGGVGNALQSGIGSLLGNAGSLSGLAGSGLSNLLSGSGLGSLLGKSGLGGIASTLGNLTGANGVGGIMNSVSSMIGGEKGTLSQASKSLSAVAGTFNVMALKNSGCAGSALGSAASGAMQSAMGDSGNGGSPGTASSGGSDSGSSASPTDTSSTTQPVNSNDLDSMVGSDVDSTLTPTNVTPPERPSDSDLQQYGSDYTNGNVPDSLGSDGYSQDAPATATPTTADSGTSVAGADATATSPTTDITAPADQPEPASSAAAAGDPDAAARGISQDGGLGDATTKIEPDAPNAPASAAADGGTDTGTALPQSQGSAAAQEAASGTSESNSDLATIKSDGNGNTGVTGGASAPSNTDDWTAQEQANADKQEQQQIQDAQSQAQTGTTPSTATANQAVQNPDTAAGTPGTNASYDTLSQTPSASSFSGSSAQLATPSDTATTAPAGQQTEVTLPEQSVTAPATGQVGPYDFSNSNLVNPGSSTFAATASDNPYTKVDQVSASDATTSTAATPGSTQDLVQQEHEALDFGTATTSRGVTYVGDDETTTQLVEQAQANEEMHQNQTEVTEDTPAASTGYNYVTGQDLADKAPSEQSAAQAEAQAQSVAKQSDAIIAQQSAASATASGASNPTLDAINNEDMHANQTTVTEDTPAASFPGSPNPYANSPTAAAATASNTGIPTTGAPDPVPATTAGPTSTAAPTDTTAATALNPSYSQGFNPGQGLSTTQSYNFDSTAQGGNIDPNSLTGTNAAPATTPATGSGTTTAPATNPDPAPASTDTGTKAGSASYGSGTQQLAFGDSIANGVAGAGGLNGTTKIGVPASTVLNYINNYPSGQLQGADVILSTGLTNNHGDTSAYPTIEKQVQALQNAGVNSITVLGIGTGGAGEQQAFQNGNTFLQNLANQYGVNYQPLGTVGADGYHPTSYNRIYNQIKGQ